MGASMGSALRGDPPCATCQRCCDSSGSGDKSIENEDVMLHERGADGSIHVLTKPLPVLEESAKWLTAEPVRSALVSTRTPDDVGGVMTDVVPSDAATPERPVVEAADEPPAVEAADAGHVKCAAAEDAFAAGRPPKEEEEKEEPKPDQKSRDAFECEAGTKESLGETLDERAEVVQEAPRKYDSRVIFDKVVKSEPVYNFGMVAVGAFAGFLMAALRVVHIGRMLKIEDGCVRRVYQRLDGWIDAGFMFLRIVPELFLGVSALRIAYPDEVSVRLAVLCVVAPSVGYGIWGGIVECDTILSECLVGPVGSASVTAITMVLFLFLYRARLKIFWNSSMAIVCFMCIFGVVGGMLIVVSIVDVTDVNALIFLAVWLVLFLFMLIKMKCTPAQRRRRQDLGMQLLLCGFNMFAPWTAMRCFVSLLSVFEHMEDDHPKIQPYFGFFTILIWFIAMRILKPLWREVAANALPKDWAVAGAFPIEFMEDWVGVLLFMNIEPFSRSYWMSAIGLCICDLVRDSVAVREALAALIRCLKSKKQRTSSPSASFEEEDRRETVLMMAQQRRQVMMSELVAALLFPALLLFDFAMSESGFTGPAFFEDDVLRRVAAYMVLFLLELVSVSLASASNTAAMAKVGLEVKSSVNCETRNSIHFYFALVFVALVPPAVDMRVYYHLTHKHAQESIGSGC